MQIYNREITRWHERKSQEQEARHSSLYIFLAKNNINATLGNVAKKYVL